MAKLVVSGDKRMTVREVAEALSCHPEAVKQHIRKLFPQIMENGKTTYLNEAQVTIVLESMKTPVSSGSLANLQIQLGGTETSQLRSVQTGPDSIAEVQNAVTVLETAESIARTCGYSVGSVRNVIARLGFSRNSMKTVLTSEQAAEVKKRLLAGIVYAGNAGDDTFISDMKVSSLFEKAMTTREIAEALGCKIKTVFNNAKICLPNKRIENGKQTLWAENEVTVLLAYMKRNNNNQHDLVRSLQGIETAGSLELEAALAAQKAIELQQRVIEKLRKDNAEKTERLSIAEPKAETLDKITATSSDVSVRELAAILAIPHLGQNKLFQKLREDRYIDGFNRPYRQYVESGLIYEKEYYVQQLDATKQQLRITQKGVAYFADKYTLSKTA